MVVACLADIVLAGELLEVLSFATVDAQVYSIPADVNQVRIAEAKCQSEC